MKTKDIIIGQTYACYRDRYCNRLSYMERGRAVSTGNRDRLYPHTRTIVKFVSLDMDGKEVTNEDGSLFTFSRPARAVRELWADAVTRCEAYAGFAKRQRERRQADREAEDLIVARTRRLLGSDFGSDFVGGSFRPPTYLSTAYAELLRLAELGARQEAHVSWPPISAKEGLA